MDSVNFLVNDSIAICLSEVMRRSFVHPFFPVFEKLVPSISQMKRHKRLLFAWLDSIIEERRIESPEAAAERPRDLLDIFLDASDDVEFARANLITFVIAGSDTSSHTLSFLLYQLSLNSSIVEKMRSEIVEKCGPVASWPNEFLPDGSTIRDLEYCRQVFNEGLRLHPAAATGPFRVTTEEITLPSGVYIPKGTEILVPTYVVHRSMDLWGADADEFRPERFEPAQLKAKGGLAALGFQPFSLGRRNCIGSFLAEYEVMLVLCGLVMRYDFQLACDADQVEESHMVTMRPMTKLRDADGKRRCLPMHIVKRSVGS